MHEKPMNFSQELQSDSRRYPPAGNATHIARNFERLEAAIEALEYQKEKDALHFICNDAEMGKPLLEAIFSYSPYLSHLIFNNLSFFSDVLQHGFAWGWQEVQDNIAEQTKANIKTPELKHILRKAKQRVALLTAIADITESWELEFITETLSRFADLALQASTSFLLKSAHEEGNIVLPHPEQPQEGSGLIILGMGKLGAFELNYSSDIDLIVFYDPECIEYKGNKTIGHFMVKLVRDLVHIMEDRTADGYVFRTDLRLRPDPSSTPMAISVDTAIEYYESVGQNWERAAMIKVRAVAGDQKAGEAFIEELKPYVWRKYMDFAAIQDIHSIKRQISSSNSTIPENLAGYNIKVGHGGIREIEFYAQTQQLIWGGREADLRCNATCVALQALARTERTPLDTAGELIAIYRFLRTLEHRLQMMQDMQTHTIPKQEDAILDVARFMGFETKEIFFEEARHRLTRVQWHYSHLFRSAPDLGHEGSLAFTGTDSDPETIKTLEKLSFNNPAGIWQMIKNWHHGRYRCTASVRTRELLTELMPAILLAFSKTPDPDAALLRFDEFLSKLPAGIQLFSLCQANPHLLELMADIMGSYPYLAENLSRKPSLLEYVLYSDFLDPLADKQELMEGLNQRLQEARDYQDILDITRRWTHDRQFRVGVQLIKHKITPAEARHYLSDIAETVLPLLLHYTEEEFVKRRGRFEGGEFAVVALGKLGGHELMFDSDIDLIFAYDTPDPNAHSDGPGPLSVNNYYTRLSRRFISSFTALTSEGRLYEIDIRLRPSGKDGPISSSLEAFERYYTSSAWIFEYMALTRARVICGSQHLGEKVSDIIHKKLCHPREQKELAKEINQLRTKTAQVHGSTDPWNIKYIRGGLMDIEFIAQYLQLLHADKHPHVLDLNTVACFQKMEEHGLLDSQTASDLTNHASFLLDLQTLRRIAYSRNMRMDHIPLGLKNFFVRTMGEKDFASLEAKLINVEESVLRYFEKIIAGG